MVIRFGAIILVAALACGSVQAQSLLLDKGERGFLVQVGYAATRGEQARTAELDLGYAFSDRFDFGGSIGHGIAGRGWYDQNMTLAGQFADFYPLKLEHNNYTLLFGLHEAYSWVFAVNRNPWFTYAGSLNLILSPRGNGGAAVSAGIQTNESSTETSRATAVFGFTVFRKIAGESPLSLTIQYSLTSQYPDAYAIGFSYTFARD